MSNTSQHTSFKPFKFKELKVYASTEWLADNKKKYRQVFQREDTSYVYAELSFYNKLFDQEVWEVNVTLKCFEHRRNRRKICELDFRRKVSKFDNVVFIREGWGNKKDGAFWKKGTYFWEAWIEGEKVATKYFYVEEGGFAHKKDENQSFDIKSIKLYEGQYDDVNIDDRIYYNCFAADETRYVYSELIFKNKLPEQNWHCELFVKFYNESRELKGQSNKLVRVKKGDEDIVITAGWGSNVKGSWRPGHYYLDVVFLDHIIATTDFEVGPDNIEGLIELKSPYSHQVLKPINKPGQELNLQEVLEKLNKLIGLSEIKQKVADHAKYIQFLQLRKDKGFEEKDQINLFSVFTGNPGTGKTTVANMMGSLYKNMGLLSKGHVHEVDRVDLVGEYIGQTAPKVKEAIEKARGGVLFIDEAYSLARTNDDSKDFGREVIEMIIKEMSSGHGDLSIIVAGYPKEMKHFIDSNPGLKSRFKQFYEFRDYLPQELLAIAKYACKEKEVVLSSLATDRIKELIVEAFRNRDKSFGNARFVYDLMDKAKINMGLRIMDEKNPDLADIDSLQTIIEEDIIKIKSAKIKRLPQIPIDDELLEEALNELDALTGINKVKAEINETIEVVKYYKGIGVDVLNKFFFHTVFIGNPGTGKTTVARILCKIYKALGIIERGHMVETDRQGLVAGFVGQTATKTKERIDEAMGGVLFIDEAYALSNFNGLQGDYGNEAIQTILKRMEDDRGAFFIFAAGYPDNMAKFLKANPGLNSRFDKVLTFDDYTGEELIQIAVGMLKEKGFMLNLNAKEFLNTFLEKLHEKRDKYFGNARTVRKVVNEAIKQHTLRVSKLKTKAAQRSKIIKLQDMKVVASSWKDSASNRPSIGF